MSESSDVTTGLVRNEVPRALADDRSHLGKKADRMVLSVLTWLVGDDWERGGSFPITGDRGTGKSTLLLTFRERLKDMDTTLGRLKSFERARALLGELGSPNEQAPRVAFYLVEPDALILRRREEVLRVLLLALADGLERADGPFEGGKKEEAARAIKEKILRPLVTDSKALGDWFSATSADPKRLGDEFVEHELGRIGVGLNIRQELEDSLEKVVGRRGDTIRARGAIVLAIDDIDLAPERTMPIIQAINTLRGVPGLAIVVAAQPDSLVWAVKKKIHPKLGRGPSLDELAWDIARKVLGGSPTHISHLSRKRIEDFFTTSKDSSPWSRRVLEEYFNGVEDGPPDSAKFYGWLDALASGGPEGSGTVSGSEPRGYTGTITSSGSGEYTGTVTGSDSGGYPEDRQREERPFLAMVEPRTYRTLVSFVSAVARAVAEIALGEHEDLYLTRNNRLRRLIVELLFVSFPEDRMARLLYRDDELLDKLAKLIAYRSPTTGGFAGQPRLRDVTEWDRSITALQLPLRKYGFGALFNPPAEPDDRPHGNPWAYAAWYWRGILGFPDVKPESTPPTEQTGEAPPTELSVLVKILEQVEESKRLSLERAREELSKQGEVTAEKLRGLSAEVRQTSQKLSDLEGGVQDIMKTLREMRAAERSAETLEEEEG